jgi:hypothetical protein
VTLTGEVTSVNTAVVVAVGRVCGVAKTSSGAVAWKTTGGAWVTNARAWTDMRVKDVGSAGVVSSRCVQGSRAKGSGKTASSSTVAGMLAGQVMCVHAAVVVTIKRVGSAMCAMGAVGAVGSSAVSCQTTSVATSGQVASVHTAVVVTVKGVGGAVCAVSSSVTTSSHIADVHATVIVAIQRVWGTVSGGAVSCKSASCAVSSRAASEVASVHAAVVVAVERVWGTVAGSVVSRQSTSGTGVLAGDVVCIYPTVVVAVYGVVCAVGGVT